MSYITQIGPLWGFCPLISSPTFTCSPVGMLSRSSCMSAHPCARVARRLACVPLGWPKGYPSG